MEKQDRKVRTRLQAVLTPLTDLYALYSVLHHARIARGAIDFNLPETKIVFGKNRKIDKIVAYERFQSHRVIEECMLAANISAAKFLAKHSMPALYRIHEGPKERKLDDLRQFLRELGLLSMRGTKRPEPKDYAKILQQVENRPDAHMIQTVLLRSMSQAVYSPENKGHFGLAYEAYTHFTSPIRRYPDLLVHRAIKAVLAKEPPISDINHLSRFGEHCSMTERRADEATREVTDWLKCEYMLDKVGGVFDGIISGVTGFGIFVELRDIYVEGLVHISTLPRDYYRFDAVKHVLHGERSGTEFRLGNQVRVAVARVNVDEREIDLLIEEDPAPAKKSGKRKKHKH
jgi:ribonuclease R